MAEVVGVSRTSRWQSSQSKDRAVDAARALNTEGDDIAVRSPDGTAIAGSGRIGPGHVDAVRVHHFGKRPGDPSS
jgi:hypothetical protein